MERGSRHIRQGKETDFSVPAVSTIIAEALGATDDSGSTDSALVRFENPDVSQSH